ncbi:transporter [Sporocytophaga myxococcoides]|uniref:Transporter n=1 Tax=Sporocytophaga myxococcoides TaxID=153721 RepID=A0A098LA96_9BACT|nr:helix-hairpin-helix domain-containing protein [Sporocytophaga myxococcoides]GAL83841.1 transporter [Sporocytophaga myxococcoides]
MNLIERCKSYFGISKKEAHGFIVLQAILCLVLTIPFLTEYFIFPQKRMDRTENGAALDSLLELFEAQSESFTDKNESITNPSDKFPESFDPNIASKELFLMTGLKSTLVERIIKFREKGGKFFAKEDLLKIYGMDKTEFEKIAPCLTFRTHSKPKLIEQKAPDIFDINKADSVSLEQLNGIGPTLARRILKYKNALGGFVSKDQYLEIYGLTEYALTQLNRYTFINRAFEPERIHLYNSEFKKIAGHPYIGYKAAQYISKLKKTGFSEDAIHSIIRTDTVFKCKKPELIYRYIEIGQ